MARVTVEDCLDNVDSRFTLVHLAVRRVLQLRHGSPLLLDNVKSNKEVVLALREIAAGKINQENIRTIEEPMAEAMAEAEADRSEIREILQEATSYSPSIEYGASDELLPEDQPPEETPEE